MFVIFNTEKKLLPNFLVIYILSSHKISHDCLKLFTGHCLQRENKYRPHGCCIWYADGVYSFKTVTFLL